MKNKIKKLESLVGKTIAAVEKDYGDLWLKFSDNTFAVLTINDITEGFGYEKKEIDIHKYNEDKTNRVLLKLGLITKQEYKEACKQEEERYQKAVEKRKREEEERIRTYELDQLNKLKQKYE